MSDSIKIYQKPTCSKCREAMKVLRDSGLAFEAVDYTSEPLTAAELSDLIQKLGVKPRDLLRTKEDTYRKLNLARRELSDDHLITLMVTYPQLIQRPIVERGGRAVIGRPIENVKRLIESE